MRPVTEGKDGGADKGCFSLAASTRVKADAASVGLAFGGEARNPSATVYVVDACHGPRSGLLATVASDGSRRVFVLDHGDDGPSPRPGAGPSLREMGAEVRVLLRVKANPHSYYQCSITTDYPRMASPFSLYTGHCSVRGLAEGSPKGISTGG